MLSKADRHRLRFLKVRQTVAWTFVQSGFPASLTGWQPEWKEELLNLEQRLADEEGKFIKGPVDNYKIVSIPDA